MRLRLARELSEHSEHLLGRDHDQAEGQVCGHFDRAPDMYMSTSVLFVQMGVYPPDRAAFAVAHGFGGRELAFLAPPRVVVDGRLFFLQPQSQLFGKSARLASKSRSSCCCRRLGSGGGANASGTASIG